MAATTSDLHVRVMTLDPAAGAEIPVPDATVRCRNSDWCIDGTLSTADATTAADGKAKLTVTFDEGEKANLNPYFEIELPDGKRKVPAAKGADLQIDLPEEWETRHADRHGIPNIAAYTDAAKPLVLYVGLPSTLGISYTDFHSFDQAKSYSGLRNPLALPQDTVQVYLADYDTISADDPLGGFGFDRRTTKVVKVGDELPKAGYTTYPYADEWPTAPWAMDAPASPPGAWLDPPGAPVGRLGGGSFRKPGLAAPDGAGSLAGALAVDGHGFVFLIDGDAIRRFYPDGTLTETIRDATLVQPRGLAVDSYRNLFVADVTGNQIVMFRPSFGESGSGVYVRAGALAGLSAPHGLSVFAQRAVDKPELLAVADTGSQQVRVHTIDITDAIMGAGTSWSNRSMRRQALALTQVATFAGPAPGFGLPVDVAFDRIGRLYVCDRAKHTVSRWGPDAPFAAWHHEADYGAAGGVAGAGDAEFDTPEAVAVDLREDYLYVAESGNHRVQRLHAPTGAHQLHWIPAAGIGATAVALSARGEVYAADMVRDQVHRARHHGPGGNFLGATTQPAKAGEPWTAASDRAHMSAPSYLHLAADGTLWVADSGNDRVLAFARDAAGVLTLKPDPTPLAGLKGPRGIVTASDGDIFVVDTGNDRVRRYDAAHAHKADIGTAKGAGATELDGPRGIALVEQRDAPLLYVADTNNDRVQVIGADGTFKKAITTGGGALKKPEDVAFDANGHLFVADSLNHQIVHFDDKDAFVARIDMKLPAVAGPLAMLVPSGVSVDADGNLLVTDRAAQVVLSMKTDGTVLAYWDLLVLVRHRAALATDAASGTVGDAPSLSPGSGRRYDPDLARQVVFQAPCKSVIDARGLLAVADPDLDQVRLVRTRTNIDTTLIDLDERLPDVSLRVRAHGDWRADLGLAAAAVQVNHDWPNFGGIWYDDDHSFSSEPVESFAGDRFDRRQLLDAKSFVSGAVNVLRVARAMQRWLHHITRGDAPDFRWGVVPDKLHKLYFDLTETSTSFHGFDSEAVHLMSPDAAGRGMDAWDDSVIAHEMTHWMVDLSVAPAIPFKRVGGAHGHDEIMHPSTAILEGYAEYVEHFWGTEYGRSDRLRGFPFTGNSALEHLKLPRVNPNNKAEVRRFVYLFGGNAPPTAAMPGPTFDTPGRAVSNEGYFANAIHQIHVALVEAEILFADAPTYWYGYNTNISEARSALFCRIVRQALRSFPEDPSDDDVLHGSRMYARQLLARAHAETPEIAQMVASILELNNLANPSIAITVGASTTAAGTATGVKLSVVVAKTSQLIIRVTDATGAPLAGHRVNVTLTAATGGAAAGAIAFDGPEPGFVRGFVDPAAVGRPTNASGIVNLTYTAPAAGAPKTDTLTVYVQPDFDTDATFAPPKAGADLATTARQLVLYELRAASKVWPGVGSNLGAIVGATLDIDVTAA